MKTLTALAFGIAIAATTWMPADAAAMLVPAASAQACAANGVDQADMAGAYVGGDAPMRLEVFGCGGIFIQWDNAYGTHTSAYGTFSRLTDGTLVADVLPGMGIPLDGSRRLGVKPAEPGYIQAITFGVYDGVPRVYRLRKL